MQRPQQSPPCSPTRPSSLPLTNPTLKMDSKLVFPLTLLLLATIIDSGELTVLIPTDVKPLEGAQGSKMGPHDMLPAMGALTNGRRTYWRLDCEMCEMHASVVAKLAGCWLAGWQSILDCYLMLLLLLLACCFRLLVGAAACWPARRHLLGAKPGPSPPAVV